MRYMLTVVLAVYVCAAPLASAQRVRVLAIASDPTSCEELSRAVRPYGIEMAVVVARADTLEALASDGADLHRQYDVVFVQAASDLPGPLAEFSAVLADAVLAGTGLVVEGGQSSYREEGLLKTHLARLLPVAPVKARASGSRVQGRPRVLDEHSPLLRFLGWAKAPLAVSCDSVVAKRGANVHLAVDGAPCLVTWRIGGTAIVAFAGGLTGPWTEPWKRWSSFDAFRARLFHFAAGAGDGRLKTILPAGPKALG